MSREFPARRRLHADPMPLVGLVMNLATRHFREVMRGVMDYVREHQRWRFVVNLAPDRQAFARSANLDGLIAQFLEPGDFEQIAHGPVRAVNVAGSMPDTPALPTVRLDDAAIGRLAAEHFLQAGFSHGAYYRLAGRRTEMARCQNFTEAMAAAGATCHVFDRRGPGNGGQPQSADEWGCTQDWVRDLPKPIAMFITNDFEGRVISQCCLELGIAVPEEVALLAVDNDDLLTEVATPPLSSIETGARRVGFEAARVLDAMFRGDAPPEAPIEVPPVRIVVRQSSDVLAIEDPLIAQAVRFIRHHACEPCNVGDLLRAVPISRRQLELRFKKYLGRTPHAEMVRVRLSEARRLLAETDLPIEAVAERSGFGFIQNLAKAMREADGQTPAAYRRQTRNPR